MRKAANVQIMRRCSEPHAEPEPDQIVTRQGLRVAGQFVALVNAVHVVCRQLQSPVARDGIAKAIAGREEKIDVGAVRREGLPRRILFERAVLNASNKEPKHLIHPGLRLIALTDDNFIALVRAGWRVLAGRVEDGAEFIVRSITNVRLNGDRPVPVQIDGEAFGTTPVEIEPVAEALRIVVGQ